MYCISTQKGKEIKDMKGEQIGIAGFRAKKKDHDEIERNFREGLDFEEANPEYFHYKFTRYYNRDVPGNPEEEYWMFIDHFEDFQDYLQSLKSAAQRPETVAAQQMLIKNFSLATGFLNGEDIPKVDGPEGLMAGGLANMMNLIEVWTEVPSLRVDDLGE